MNIYNVPKKINRHVLKAVNVLSNGNIRKGIPINSIINQVRYQIRNLVPVPNLESVVQKSLNNLSDIGVIKKAGPHRFAIGHSYAQPPGSSIKPNLPVRHLFKTNVS